MEISVLLEVFAEYFVQKVAKIRSGLLDSLPYNDVSEPCQSKFSHFTAMTVDDVTRMIRQMSPKTCAIDPMPTYLVKDSLDILAPILTKIVNESFRSGTFPADCKSAIVRPLIKKTGLDRNDPRENERLI